jgi:hypothetical protein
MKMMVVFASLLVVTPAIADTCLISNASRFQLNSDAVEWAMQIVSGQSCIRGLNYGAVRVDEVKLLSPPQSGQVTLTGPGFSYAAKANFQGQDVFTLQVSGSMLRIRGTSEIKVLVSVGESKSP